MVTFVKPSGPSPEQIAAFAKGAETHTLAPIVTLPTPATKPAAPTQVAAPGSLAFSFLLRLTPEESDLLNKVFAKSVQKSKQKLIRSIVIEALKAMDDDIK